MVQDFQNHSHANQECISRHKGKSNHPQAWNIQTKKENRQQNQQSDARKRNARQRPQGIGQDIIGAVTAPNMRRTQITRTRLSSPPMMSRRFGCKFSRWGKQMAPSGLFIRRANLLRRRFHFQSVSLAMGFRGLRGATLNWMAAPHPDHTVAVTEDTFQPLELQESRHQMGPVNFHCSRRSWSRL